jgi:serine/threonine protein phosphatase PrpC
MGDTIAHDIGVVSNPEVKSFLVGIEDKFVVIGSDGVWEFLSNEEIAKIVIPFY